MKIVNIEVLPARDNEVVTAVITEETKKGGSWQESSKNTVESGTPDARRSIRLDDDDRVVIEGKVEGEVRLDNDQRAATKVWTGKRGEEEKKKNEERTKRVEEQAKKEKEEFEKNKPEEAKLREEQAKQRDEKIMGKQDKDDKSKEDVSKHEAPVKIGDKGTQYPPLEQVERQHPTSTSGQSQSDAGLRTEVPRDSRSVGDHTSTTKPKK